MEAKYVNPAAIASPHKYYHANKRCPACDGSHQASEYHTSIFCESCDKLWMAYSHSKARSVTLRKFLRMLDGGTDSIRFNRCVSCERRAMPTDYLCYECRGE